jgi:hypothetical protein
MALPARPPVVVRGLLWLRLKLTDSTVWPELEAEVGEAGLNAVAVS